MDTPNLDQAQNQFSKGIIMCGIVEFYAILSLLASILMVMQAVQAV